MRSRGRIGCGFCAEPVRRLLSFSASALLRLNGLPVLLCSQRFRVEPQSLESVHQQRLSCLFSLLGFLEPFSAFTVRMVNTINPPTTADRDIVLIDLPLGAEPQQPATTWRKHTIGGKGEIFWTIGRPKSQTHWQVLSDSCQTSQRLPSSSGVGNFG